MKRLALYLSMCLVLGACEAPVTNRTAPALQVEITSAPTQNISATKTVLAEAIIPTEQPEGLYLVRDGDTLESIALAFNTTVDEITMTNGISDANTIYIGQPLIIPTLLEHTTEISTTDPLSDTEDQTKDVTPTP